MGLPAKELTRPQVAGHDLGAALLRVYALGLAAAGQPGAAAVMFAQAGAWEVTAPSAAQAQRLQAAGYLTPAQRLTPAGWAALAGVLDRAETEGGEA